MKKKEFQNLPSTDTPITAENLNEMQSNIEESCVIVSPTEPTTNEKVWIDNTNKKIYIRNDNGVYEEFIKKEEIVTGSGVENKNYINYSELNHYEKVGNIVSFSFTLILNNILENTTELYSGLPPAKVATRFMGLNAVTDKPMRFVIDKSGKVLNQYSASTTSVGNVIEGHITYICTD